jgi:hypothetical protein
MTNVLLGELASAGQMSQRREGARQNIRWAPEASGGAASGQSSSRPGSGTGQRLSISRASSAILGDGLVLALAPFSARAK